MESRNRFSDGFIGILAIVIVFDILFAFVFIINLPSSEEDDAKQKQLILSYSEVNNDSESLKNCLSDSDVDIIFAYGTINAVDTVSCSDIEGTYSYIRTTTEAYKNKKNEDNSNFTVLDEVTTTSKKLKFLSVEFNYDTINLPDATLNKTDWLSYDAWSAYNPLYLYNPINRNFFMSFCSSYRAGGIRRAYYVKECSYSGTLILQKKDKTLTPITFYPDKTIDQAKRIVIDKNCNSVADSFSFLGVAIGLSICAIFAAHIYYNKKNT